MGSRPFRVLLIPLVLATAVSLVGGSFALAGEEKAKKDDRPQRAISIAPEYTGVIIPPGEKVSMDLTVYNEGKSDENIDVDITSIPKGWKAEVKTYEFAVTGVHVRNGESKRLTFSARPEKKEVAPGRYLFRVRARTRDGKLTSSQDIAVTVSEKAKTKKEEPVTITTSYPVLRGPTDAAFEFSVEVANKLDKDKVYSLFSRGPEDWEVNFKPGYEEKYISSLRIKANQSESVAVEVKPSPSAQPGEYPVYVRVGSGRAKSEAKLTVIITGNYKLDVGTSTGLLSLEAQKGKSANVSIYVKNSGTATNHDIKFVSIKPENWKVDFEPDRIDALKPDELKQVEVTITPAEEALVGDYSVGLNINGEKASNNIEMRVTVKASTAWGWIGIGIIVLVVVGLGGLFTWLGRR